MIKNYILNHENIDGNLGLIDKLESNIIDKHFEMAKQLITNYFSKTN